MEKFEFHRGRTYTRDFTITDYTDPVDKMYFTVCENPKNKNACLQKKLNDGITIVDTGINEEGTPYTTYNLLIEATDTEHMKTNFEYGFDITIISGAKKVQVMEGTMLLNDTYTKTCNEC